MRSASVHQQESVVRRVVLLHAPLSLPLGVTQTRQAQSVSVWGLQVSPPCRCPAPHPPSHVHPPKGDPVPMALICKRCSEVEVEVEVEGGVMGHSVMGGVARTVRLQKRFRDMICAPTICWHVVAHVCP